MKQTELLFNWNNIQTRADGKILLLYRHERIFKEKLFRKGYKVADVGGWGHLSERIRQEGGECIILDKFTEDQYFPDRVRNEPHIEMDICCSLDQLKAFENSFDLITCYEVLEHVNDQPRAIKNMYYMLKYNAHLAGTFPIPGGTHPADDPHVTFIDKDTLTKYLKEAGFKDIIVEPTPSINEHDLDRPSLYFKGCK